MTYTVYENKILRNGEVYFSLQQSKYKFSFKELCATTLLVCKLLNAAEAIVTDNSGKGTQ